MEFDCRDFNQSDNTPNGLLKLDSKSESLYQSCIKCANNWV